MGQVIAGLDSLGSWVNVWSGTFKATTTQNTYIPIAEVSCPFPLSSNILAITTKSQKSPNRWKSAGFLTHKIQIAFLSGSVSQVGSGYRVFLNRTTLLVLPNYSSRLFVSFDIHYWIQDISINIWSYTGTINDSTEQLIKEVRDINLSAIEQKIDDIATYGGN